jgi:cell division septation protein DedD
VSANRGPRALLVAVCVTTAALVGLARWAGRIAGHVAAGRTPPRSGAPARADAATPELSFYHAIGGGAGTNGRAPTPPADGRGMRPAPGDAVAPTGAYVVQVLATRDKREADRMHDRLSRRGYASSIDTDDAPGGPIYRVRVGRWKERGPADAMAKTLREKEGLEPWILQEGGA